VAQSVSTASGCLARQYISQRLVPIIRRALEASRTIFSLDTASKAGARNDYLVILVISETKNGLHVRLVSRGRWEFPELKRRAEALAAIWKPNAVLVEDAASGQSLIQALKSQTILPILPVRPIEQQEDEDRYECHSWTVQPTGFDPRNAYPSNPKSARSSAVPAVPTARLEGSRQRRSSRGSGRRDGPEMPAKERLRAQQWRTSGRISQAT
jgi:Terminase RNaseH-like domain